MSNKRVRFIGLSYLGTALLMNSQGITGAAYLIALVAIIVVAYFVYPSDEKEDKEQIYPGRDPRM